jgi:hypothetical protein
VVPSAKEGSGHGFQHHGQFLQGQGVG